MVVPAFPALFADPVLHQVGYMRPFVGSVLCHECDQLIVFFLSPCFLLQYAFVMDLNGFWVILVSSRWTVFYHYIIIDLELILSNEVGDLIYEKGD